MSAKKKSSLERLQQQANQARGGSTAANEMGEIFDDLLTPPPTPKPTRVTITPVTRPPIHEKEAVWIQNEPKPIDGGYALPEEEYTYSESVTVDKNNDSPDDIGEDNYFRQTWAAFQAHKFFNFLVRHGSSFEGQYLTQPLIARFSEVSLPTVKLLTSKMTKLGIITTEHAQAGNKKNVVYRPVEKYVQQFIEIYGDSFPKNKRAYKSFHEMRLKQLLKPD